MRIPLLLAGLLALATSTFGQGLIYFGNSSTTLIRTNDLAGNIGPISSATGAYQFELLVAPAGTAVAPTSASLGPWTILATGTNHPILAGRFFCGMQKNTLTTPGGPMAVMVRGWLASSSGIEFDNSPMTGSSSILQLAVSGSPNPPSPPPADIFGTVYGADLLQGFDLVGRSISVVPEPSVVALGVLGVSAIALFRRRKH